MKSQLRPIFGEIKWTPPSGEGTLHVAEFLGTYVFAAIVGRAWRVMGTDGLAHIRFMHDSPTGEEYLVRCVEGEFRREWDAYKAGIAPGEEPKK